MSATPQELFRQWCGNSYEWDALTDIEHQRWIRLNETLRADLAARDAVMEEKEGERKRARRRADDYRTMLARIVHLHRKGNTDALSSVMLKADELLRRMGDSSPLRSDNDHDDSDRLDVLSEQGAELDIYWEPDGKWSIRERGGERAVFNDLRDLCDTLLARLPQPTPTKP